MMSKGKIRLQLIIWVLLFVRSQYGMLDDGARFHLLSHLIRETVNIGKSMLATSLVSRDDTLDPNYNLKDAGSIQNLIQKDRVLAAISDEANYTQISKIDRAQQVQELHIRIDENTLAESSSKQALEDEIQNSLNSILSSDDSRRAEFQLTYEEEQQNVAEKWIHMFRSLIDERGPWSTKPFPNCIATHWKLDKTEDTWRRRPKLRQNYHFDENLCNPPSATASGIASPVNESNPGFVGNIPEQMKQLLLKGIRKITDEGTFDSNETNTEISGPNTSIPPDHSDSHSSDLLKDNSDRKDVVHERRDTPSSPETEASKVLVSIPCVLVTPKRKLAGHLAVMKNVLSLDMATDTETSSTTPPQPTTINQETWNKLLGNNNWETLLNPLDLNLRNLILRCGDFIQTTYDSFNNEKIIPLKFPPQPRTKSGFTH